MTLAPRHRVHLLCVASLAHLRCTHRLGCSLAGFCWRVSVGLAPGPPLNFKVRPFSAGGGPLECLFPYLSTDVILRVVVGAQRSSPSSRRCRACSGNHCFSSPSNNREAIRKTGNPCPRGWFSSGSYCVKSR